MNSTEVLVLAGASAGAIRLWDLEEAKMVRTLTGHRDNYTATEFHPFGGFDNVVKVWDLPAGKLLHDFKYHKDTSGPLIFIPLNFS